MGIQTNNLFENCKTPQELYDVIEKVLRPSRDSQSRKSVTLDKTRAYGTFFEGDQEYYGQNGRLFDKRTLEQVQVSPDPVLIYEDARTCALTFRNFYPRLPTLPPHNSNAVAGLQEIMEWCIESFCVVDNIVVALDRQTISALITQLKKLRDLPARRFPLVDADLWRKAEDEARTIVEKGRKKQIKIAGLNVSEKTRRELERDNEIIEACDVHRKALQIYLSKDQNFWNGLYKLEEEIREVIDKINELGGSSTPTGKLLDAYSRLKDTPLQQQYERIGRAFEIRSLTESLTFGGPGNLSTELGRTEALVNDAIQILREIEVKAAWVTTLEEPREIEQKARSLLKKIIGWIFKKTSHFICAIVVALIATVIAGIIVDVIADFGWIQRIKEFFTK